MVILVICRLAWGITNRGSTVNIYINIYFYYLLYIYIYYAHTPVHEIYQIYHLLKLPFHSRYAETSIKNCLTPPQRHVHVACKGFNADGRYLPKCLKMATSSPKNR